jgi:hypothetical protein
LARTPDELATELKAALAAGGCTIDRDGRHLRRGIAVCAEPELALSFPVSDWCTERVTSWLVDIAPRLAIGDVHLGGWIAAPDGHVWLEPVWVFPDELRLAAVALGRAYAQAAVFDLGRRELVSIVERHHEVMV